MAAAQRTQPKRRRRYAPCGNRIPQRALSAGRRQTTRRISRRPRGALSLRRRALGAAAHQSAASLQWAPQAPWRAAQQRSRAARARRHDRRGARERGRRSRPRRHRMPLVFRMGSASARPSGGEAAAVCNRENRRRAGEQTRGSGAAVVRRKGARSHAHHRRAGLRAHARGAWRRCAADHRQAFGGDAAAGHGYRPRQIIGVDRPPRSERARDAGGAGARCRRVRPRLPARRHCRAWVLAARRRSAPPRHCLCLALRLWARGPVGQSAWI